jgi:hypothetical protein
MTHGETNLREIKIYNQHPALFILVKWLHVSVPNPGHHQAIPQSKSGKIVNNCEYCTFHFCSHICAKSALALFSA